MGLCQSSYKRERNSRKKVSGECVGKPCTSSMIYLNGVYPKHSVVTVSPGKNVNYEPEPYTIIMWIDNQDVVTKINFI
jgi:hypothetical protein